MRSVGQLLPANGVSLQFLKDFADENNIDDSVTAGEVCARVVKAATAEARVSMATVLQDGRDTSGAAWCGNGACVGTR